MTTKLLVIADLVHASPRMPGLLNGLAAKDWNVTIITPELPAEYQKVLGFPNNFEDKVEVIQTPNPKSMFKLIRKFFTKSGYDEKNSILEQLKSSSKSEFGRRFVKLLFNLFMEIYAFPDLEKNWKKVGIKYASVEIKDFCPDLILSSSPFPTSHRVASFLSSKFGISWVADYRDPWVVNPVYQYGFFRKKVESHLERYTLRNATQVITVSESYASAIQSFLHRSVSIIPNGYIEYHNLDLEISREKKIEIIHTGNLYFPQHNVRMLFEALQLCRTNGAFDIDDFKITFYGRIESEVQDLIVEFGVSEFVKQSGPISRIESVARQKKADALLFFNWDSNMESGLSHLKFYEYLNSLTPILVVGAGHNKYTEIIESTGTGFICESATKLSECLTSFSSESISQCKNMESIRNLISDYSYNHLSLELEKVLLASLKET